MRQFLTASRYGAEHAKVIAISAGAGSVAGMRHASWGAAKGAFQGGGLLALIFTITLSTAEWLADYEQRDPQTGKPKRDVFDLCFKVGVEVAKVLISAAIGSAIMGAFVLAVGSTTIVLPVVLIVSGAFLFSVGAGLLVEWLDRQTETTEKLGRTLRGSIKHLYEKMPKDYVGYDNSIEAASQFGLGA